MITEFLITSLIIVLMPGTGVIFTVSIGLMQGGKASLFAAIGCTAGIVPHLMASVFGLAAILHASALAFQVFKIMGVLYLAYLAWSMWKESGTGSPVSHMLLLSGIFMLMTFIVFIAYGLLADHVRLYIARSPMVIRRIQQAFAGVFVALGFKLAAMER